MDTEECSQNEYVTRKRGFWKTNEVVVSICTTM